MRKIIPLLLVVAMLLSMSLSAAATQTTEVGTTNVKATYVAGEEAELVISVDIDWDGMEFTYNGASDPVWDPENHQYKESKSGWDESNAFISIQNNSNVVLQAGITYTAKEETYNTMWLNFTDTAPYIGSAETAEIGAEEGGTPCVVIIPTVPMGTLSASGEEVGTIKVTVKPATGPEEAVTAIQAKYKNIPLRADKPARGKAYFDTADERTNVGSAAEDLAVMLGSSGLSTAEKNQLVNDLITSYYNNLHLMQDTTE